MFELDLERIRELATPLHRRTEKMLAWLEALVEPIQQLHTDFLQFREDAIFQVAFTSQIIYLEFLLNFRFDQQFNSIWIDNTADNSDVYIYKKAELKTTLFLRKQSEAKPPNFLRKIQEINSIDFIVNVSNQVTFDESAMRAVINFYKLAGKQYIIQTY